MKEIFLSGKEKRDIYKESERHVRRKRTKVGALLHSLNMAHTAFIMLGKGPLYFSVNDILSDAEQRHVWCEYNWRKQDLIRMKKRGLIEFEKVTDGFEVSLTTFGYTEVLKDKILSCNKELSDGKVCLVSYDIPEYERNERERFRRMLKSCGFIMLHASTWVSNMDVGIFVQEYADDSGMSEWVEICIVIARTKNERPLVFGTRCG